MITEEVEFNWYTELENAIKEEPTEQKYAELKAMSRNWVTCACGQLCKALPRRACGGPQDQALFNYGTLFVIRILDREFGLALDTLNLIEKQTIYLLTK